MGDDGHATSGKGTKVLSELWQGLIPKVLREEVQQRTANERQIRQKVGIARARTIFTHQDVATPMIADFNPTPVSTNQSQPLLRSILFGRYAGEVISGFGGTGAGLFDGPFAVQDDQGSGKGKLALEGFNSKGVQLPGFDSPMAGLGLGKKGVSFNASNP